ncbi:hypothetical protein [Sphingomonas jatrophae]|uniref:Phage shock protein B n=1 Tax=Sphingomonas jatrophae TaxID=1166337 RepID=A0A1I6JYR2_9SPHN|nr:hypothetical protein [Sphingomonas jatrophae]SFR84102.1 hypothetical protein SAMN05192580_1093 [Sphingomonas jatrophae]
MNIWEMIVLIVAIGAVASVLRARYGIREDAEGNQYPIADPDAARAREEIRNLKERIAVLERIATENDRSHMLDREIERLRDRP